MSVVILLPTGGNLDGQSFRNIVYQCLEFIENGNDALLLLHWGNGDYNFSQIIRSYVHNFSTSHVSTVLIGKHICVNIVCKVFGILPVLENNSVTTRDNRVVT